MSSDLIYAQWRQTGTAQPGYSPELIPLQAIKHNFDLDTMRAPMEASKDTLLKAFLQNVEKMPSKQFLGQRTSSGFSWLTFQEVHERAQNFSLGLEVLGLTQETEDEGRPLRFIGVQSKTRMESYLAFIGSMYQSITAVGFYDTLGDEQIMHIVDLIELRTMCAASEHIEKLTRLKREGKETGGMASLSAIISMDEEVPDAEKKNAQEQGITVYTMNEVIKAGAAHFSSGKESFRHPEEDDPYIMCFTSGTTGMPKGVKITHGMLNQSAVSAYFRFAQSFPSISNEDSYISYLPQGHVLEHLVSALSFNYGMKIGCYGGDVFKLVADIAELKPTVFPTVPRLLNKIYSRIQAKLGQATGCKLWLAKTAIQQKISNFRRGEGVKLALFDFIMFSKIQQLLGGKIKYMVTGSAPIASDVLEFLKIAFSCPIFEGYGLTETTGASYLTFGEDQAPNQVGGPVANVKVRLRDIPEMNYFSTDNPPHGEVCFKGSGVFKGYYKNPGKTEEAFDSEGWFFSGDVGQVNPNGSLRIIDRAKNIFKLSQGEYIAPEKLENIFIQSRFISQIWIYGDSLRDYIIAIIVADPDGIDGEAAEAIQDPSFKQAVLDDIYELADYNKLISLERPKQLHLTLDPFTVESGLLTPTMKLKRPQAKEAYLNIIKELYELPPMQKPPKKAE